MRNKFYHVNYIITFLKIQIMQPQISLFIDLLLLGRPLNYIFIYKRVTGQKVDFQF
jgi:hypothetical protein